MAEVLDVETEGEAATAMREIGCSEAGVRIMAPKAVFKVVKLRSVRNAIANILKQEMLAVGGDAAVAVGTVNCRRPATDVVLMGTLKQYALLVAKMRNQVSESRKVAEEIEAALAASGFKLKKMVLKEENEFIEGELGHEKT